MPSFDATHSLLGYLHQVLVGLQVLLDKEEASLRIESLDDLTLFEGDQPSELLQVKHHSKQASLSDSSKELWKTLRLWSVRAADQEIDTSNVYLHLITTATAPEGSAAAQLRPGKGRDIRQAHRLLLDVLERSKDRELRAKYFPPFADLGKQGQLSVLARIDIADKSPDISDMLAAISRRLSIGTYRERRDALIQRVEGWWFQRAVENLRDSSDQISGRELFDHIARVAEQLKPEALPIDFFDLAPSRQQHQSLLERVFVAQLHSIRVSTKRIEKAVTDYYRAFEQRSRWVREDLVVDGELDRYEARLIDEWERFRLSVEDEQDLANASEQSMQQLGRSLLNWMEQVADVRIRPSVTEPYVMRGSYHLLADKEPPNVWWHPRFLERLEQVLSGATAQ